jgi:hypothetical protein
MTHFWKDGLGLDETKVSALVLLTILLTLFAIVIYIVQGDISANLLALAQTFVISVAGANSITAVSKVIQSNTNNQVVNDIVNKLAERSK